MFRVIWKEIRVAVVCGITLGVANFAKLMLVDHLDFMVAVVVCGTMVLTVFLAKVV